MAADPRKRQKKLQRRAAKSKEKRQALGREKAAGLPGQLAAAARLPIVDCLADSALIEVGIGNVLLSRDLGNGSVAFACFLIDRYCLGVKSVAVGIRGRLELEAQIRDMESNSDEFRMVSPSTARRFVEDAVEYARKLGFEPHSDYARGRLLFGSIDPAEATETLDFGRDGKPSFVRGPYDSDARTMQILSTLERVCGPDGYTYVMELGAAESMALLSDASELDDYDDEDTWERIRSIAN
jgi:hypothetical protein